MEQINMFEAIELSASEKTNLFFNNVSDILRRNERTELSLNIENTRTYSKIGFDKKSADIRVVFGKKASYFSIHKRHMKEADLHNIRYDFDLSKEPWLRIDILDPNEVYHYEGLICDIYDKRFLETDPDSFDCCSHYLECSDAKSCVQPLPEVNKYCRYKMKLRQNIIFYGKNRNV